MAQLAPDAPDILYKFRGNGKKEFDRDVQCLLVDRNLYCSSPHQLNDPFDCYPAIIPPPQDMWPTLIDAEVANARPEMRPEVRSRCELLLSSSFHRAKYREEFYNQDLCNIGVLSLSDSRDHPLLWAHYGGNSYGFAVGYRATDTETNEAIPAIPVRYQPSRPQLWPFGDAGQLFELLRTKSEDWKYEREWRYIRLEDAGGCGCMSVPTNCIVEVCLGSRMKPEDKQRVITAAKTLPDEPRIYEAFLDANQFGLFFKSID